jgi:hypothetical protein
VRCWKSALPKQPWPAIAGLFELPIKIAFRSFRHDLLNHMVDGENFPRIWLQSHQQKAYKSLILLVDAHGSSTHSHWYYTRSDPCIIRSLLCSRRSLKTTGIRQHKRVEPACLDSRRF